jgi:putative esterase
MVLPLLGAARAQAAELAKPAFAVSIAAPTPKQATTGWLLVILSRTRDPEPRFQDAAATFGVDVSLLEPGESVEVVSTAPGYPVRELGELPAGDYFVQALLNVYTEFHRADGPVIFAHMDQWEGQRPELSPGNLYSKVRKVHWDPARSEPIKLKLTEVIPPLQVPADTEWVKHIKIQSKILTRFWGHPIYLGAVVLLPRDYASKANRQYPVIYQQGHFSLQGPFNFRSDAPPHTESETERRRRENRGIETDAEFYEAWRSEHFPRMIAVNFLHPTPFYDDSYAVNSANNGPYGDAIMTELIPYIESHFRIIAKPYARVLTGGSTGGWIALALQLYHPDFFGGTWALYPDPIDFRRYGLVNIYEDTNAFSLNENDESVPDWAARKFLGVERPFMRREDGQPLASLRELSELETTLGNHGRSGGILGNWEAVYGPAGHDGYPKPLWDKLTGTIDRSVAKYMREHGFDLRNYAEKNWARIGPSLVGKLHIYCGDMDNYYLNLAVYLFQDFLQNTENPHDSGDVQFGRPMKGHGWQPVTNAEMIKLMAAHIASNAPPGADLNWSATSD